jgi:nicotinate-nucleotide adenylyltransferase
MVDLAVAGVPGMRSWAVELERSGPSYSVDTLRALRAELGMEPRIVFAIGFDAFAEFATWREYQAIFGLADLVVMTRPPWPTTLSLDDLPVAARGAFRYDPASDSFRHESGHGLSLQHVTPLDISATAIRERVASRRSIRFLVPPAVEEYVMARGLYLEGSRG